MTYGTKLESMIDAVAKRRRNLEKEKMFGGRGLLAQGQREECQYLSLTPKRGGVKMFMKTGVAAFVFLMCISSAVAEERLGVAVYPGAKYDQARTKLLQSSLSVQGAAYRTSDDIAAVIAFYRKQGLLLLKTGGSSKEHARFRKVETGVDVVVESLRKDPQTNAKMPGTLIQIFKKEEKKRSQSDVSI